jgi:phosphoribosylglycinamide formyltransferase-1
MKTRLGILISGTGSNMVAIAKACQNPDFPAKVALVLSNAHSAPGLQTAQGMGLATQSIEHSNYRERAAFEARIHQCLLDHDVELVCLAGFMRILSPFLVSKWQGKMLNIHPSLLPLFPGLDTHERALASGALVHGCSVHQVTKELDDGPILGQAVVPILRDDTCEKLAKRVLVAEHQLFPEIVSRLCRQKQGNDSAGNTDPSAIKYYYT